MGASASRDKFLSSISNLIERDVPSGEEAFWDELWKVPSSPEEVFEVITPTKIRILRNSHFENLLTLFTQGIAQLCQIVETPYNIYFDQALNCVRVLGRIVPFLMEDVSMIHCSLKLQTADETGRETTGATTQFSKQEIADIVRRVEEMCWGIRNSGSGRIRNGGGGDSDSDDEDDRNIEPEPLALLVVHAAMHMLFLPQFTCNYFEEGDEEEGESSDDDEETESESEFEVESEAEDEAEIEEENKIKAEGEDKIEAEDEAEAEAEAEDKIEATQGEDQAETKNDEEVSTQSIVPPLPLTDPSSEPSSEEREDSKPSAEEISEDKDEDEDETSQLPSPPPPLNSISPLPQPSPSPPTSTSPPTLPAEAKRERKERPPQLPKLPKPIPLLPVTTSIIWTYGPGVHRNILTAAAIPVKALKSIPKQGPTASNAKTLSEEQKYQKTSQYDRNRIEVLRLMIAACSEPLFNEPNSPNNNNTTTNTSTSNDSDDENSRDLNLSRWQAVACSADAPNSVPLFYSLLNTVLGYDNNGMGIPYGGAVSGALQRELMEMSLQLLIVLLDYGKPGTVPPPSPHRQLGVPSINVSETRGEGFNIFRTVLARMEDDWDLTFCFNGFVRLLNNTHETNNTYLPNSIKALECYQEVLVLLWKFLEENPKFLNHVLIKCDANELVIPLCYLMFENRSDDSKTGLVHICTFILLKMSGERDFGVKLNKPFNKYLPIQLPLFKGTHSDFIAITMHKLIIDGSEALAPLYSCFLTIICNISPYWKTLSLVASIKLVNLFELFSSDKYLLGANTNVAIGHLALLLEVFNNAIQYQYTGNQRLVYAIIKREKVFTRVSALTLAEAKAAQKKLNVSLAAIAKSKNQQFNKGLEPTEGWLNHVKQSLPIETISRLIIHLFPQLISLTESRVVDEYEIMEFLGEITMVGLLPVPHPIIIRKYQPNDFTSTWFTAFMWGIIYLRNQALPIFDGESVKLFSVGVSSTRDD